MSKSMRELEILQISGRTVEITRRAYKRSIGLTLKMNGTIRVSAPKGIALARIRDFVESQETWIEVNLRKYETVREAYPRKTLREGELFPLLGRQLSLIFEVRDAQKEAFVENLDGTNSESLVHYRRRVHFSQRPVLEVRGDQLVCRIDSRLWPQFDRTIAHPELWPALTEFYKTYARDVLVQSMRVYTARMDLFPTGLSFRAQKTRWGSCSSRGRISLNWKMIIAPREVIDYVVIHELAHLRYYNHSASFWALVATQSPGYRTHRNWLRENQFHADFLASESELHPSADVG